MSHNLYLLRNVLTSKVLVSPSIKLDSKILAQIGEQRPQNKIRPDHWVPFLAVTGFKSAETVEALQTAIAPPLSYFGPKVQHPRPGQGKPLQGWKIPEQVIQRTFSLYTELLNNRKVHDEIFGAHNVSDVIAKRSDVEAKSRAGLQVSEMEFLEPMFSYTMWWERDEFRRIIETSTDGWPIFIEHKRLMLLRGRFPKFPESENIIESAFD
ncbi:hypothetical protein BATDEDRAFT_88411 [Batrachochytrium dendrobatidis JAM81]|uniref:Uncharacterized protein n=2 Tax=Batrachochytrium dendrobatidis TaxID=109871 RepID=F4P1U6_BATDJ|nr:uncharacterized protein BATDEDRAFT_88411 [Batrachochytrium dendrobatidis JAM81]EGF80745.1 hypothetical protein BATDEDRAFT_88411 [Batrachochytrium dendrobatidis JAM81]KAJ8328964.1 hypothetical protein O5D80_002926 [Batrachochytrium dendrobatidis]KAK5668914.1 hypothetical protein QVD99_004691 [Batrachochytrium dendrobatidis]OAJ41828.1 hypothetical protein BDEG_25370 [Batrachochytrium dendrobatidis JEL423]|eukprot:XP_006678677.1 hypothetical protein BATDEDRAFT_88411 [Batrachochytrium dendrobatidis JAM81]